MAQANAKKRAAIYVSVAVGAVVIGVAGWKFFRPGDNVPGDEVRRAVELRLTKQFETEYRRHYDYPKDFPVPPKGSALPDQTAAPAVQKASDAAERADQDKSAKKTRNRTALAESSVSKQQNDEITAAAKLKEARHFQETGDTVRAKERCRDIIDNYPATKAAEEAITLLNSLE
jgi:hypothetical protein